MSDTVGTSAVLPNRAHVSVGNLATTHVRPGAWFSLTLPNASVGHRSSTPRHSRTFRPFLSRTVNR